MDESGNDEDNTVARKVSFHDDEAAREDSGKKFESMSSRTNIM